MNAVLLVSATAMAYVAAIGIVMMPVYLRLLGIEAMGLIGLYLMLQAWVQVLDLGITPTVSREMSMLRGGRSSAREARLRLRVVEWVAVVSASAAIAVLVTGRQWIAREWLGAGRLDHGLVSTCIALMAAAATARWLSGIYRAVLIGMERQVRANALLAGFATLRFIAVVPLLLPGRAPLLVFFAFQAVTCALELAVLARHAYAILPGRPAPHRFDYGAFRAIWPTASAMAFMSGMWILVTQIDKLLLSRALSLADYGYFTLAVTAASAVLFLVPLLNQLLQPRLTVLAAQGSRHAFEHTYLRSTRLAALAFLVLGGTAALFAEPLMWAWTGSAETARATAPILFWYALSNAVAGVLSVAFTLQFALGYLRMHVVGNVLLTFTLLPALVLAIDRLGATGAGRVLCAGNMLYLLLWIPLIHRRLLPGLAGHWFGMCLLPMAVASAGTLGLAALAMPADLGRYAGAAYSVLAALTATAAGLLVHTRCGAHRLVPAAPQASS